MKRALFIMLLFGALVSSLYRKGRDWKRTGALSLLLLGFLLSHW